MGRAVATATNTTTKLDVIKFDLARRKITPAKLPFLANNAKKAIKGEPKSAKGQRKKNTIE
jgi:hypothetical protein